MEPDSKTWQAHAKAILKALIFIQENIDRDLNLDQVAKTAGFSPYHFHRIFRAFTGESLNHYVRRLRVEKAAGHLRYTDKKVTDIALDSGYQTPSSFSRAFQQVMGLSPHGYRSKERGGISKNQTNKERGMIRAEIIQMENQDVLFVRRVGSYEDTPADAWKTLLNFAKSHHLNIQEARRFSNGLDDPNITEHEKLRFDACITAPKERIEEGDVGRQTIKGGKYAVFIHRGPYETLEETFDLIFQQWYPDHKDEVAEQACFCEHLNMELMESHPQELLTKIYVPLKSK